MYAPDYLPTGEPINLPGAGSSSGLYSDPTMPKLINQTIFSNIKLTNYGKYTTTSWPVLWDPLNSDTLEVVKILKISIDFQDALWTQAPEYSHY